jgi:CBS domain-containing protein
MAHKQPDFRQNQNPASRGSEGRRTDEVIGRFQPTSSASTSTPGSASTQAPAREESGRSGGGGLGRFFRAASERLTHRRAQGRDTFRSSSRDLGSERPGGTIGQGLREGSYRDDTRSFDDVRSADAQRYGRSGSGAGPGVDVDPAYDRSFERSEDRSFDREAETRFRQTPYEEARDIQRRGYPEASYGGGMREDRGLYTDPGRREGRSSMGRGGGEGYIEGYREAGSPRRSRWQREPLTAQEIMTRNPRTVRRESPLRDAAQIMKDENVGIVPVVDEGQRLVGVLTDRDVVVRAFVEERQPASFRVADVMTDDVEAVTPEESIHEIIELMGRKQIRRVPVVDREDRLLGIIAMADIANRAAQDEELQEALERISSRRSFWHRLT